MIIYFADRAMRVLGHASTTLPEGYVISEDLNTEDVETGVASFSCYVGYKEENRIELEVMTNAGNYLLRSLDGENKFYTIIDSEINTKNQEIYIYAEDAGLDLINEIAGEFEAPDSYNAEWYINKYIIDSGFEIGINEIPTSTKRQLKWEGESSVTERLASIATQFGGYEISFSFAIKGLEITNKYIHFHKERGQDNGVQLRLNKEIDKIVTSRSVANLVTAYSCTGGVPDDSDVAITLKGYTYDDGDFYVDTNGLLKSRRAAEKWSRYVWNKEPNKLSGYEGHIVRPYSYNTTSQAELCSHAITELKKFCDMEVNYEADIKKLPAGVKIGDRVNIIDDAGGLYLSTRILKLETSVTAQKSTATLGDHLIKTSGISQKVAALAAEFATTSISAARALAVASTAQVEAESARARADGALEQVEYANQIANQAQEHAHNARVSANTAQMKATEAQEAVDTVEESVKSLNTTVTNAQQAAQDAWNYADEASYNAALAKSAAEQAKTDAETARSIAGGAEAYAMSAYDSASAAQTAAGEAKTQAQSASNEAESAWRDAQTARTEVDSLGSRLTTVSNTMQADYARKTDLTETAANLQSQISQNAGQISLTVTQVVAIDETANGAKEKAEAAQTAAATAQAEAENATADALKAKQAADAAAEVASSAQSEADKAKVAALNAKTAADQAESDLAKAKEDLATVQGRVDATEEEIEAAQAAVDIAQSTAETAKANAATAAEKATAAQNTADTAVTNAADAQTAANDAAAKAGAAQQTANEAKGDASKAQTKANEAASVAAAAQSTANTAVANAATAQTTANQAAEEAAAAQQAAEDADARAEQAQGDLDTAKQNLEAVTSRVGATEAEVEAAQAAVEAAQDAADRAQAEAVAARSDADTAKANAETAQTAADNAKKVADAAQAEAEEARAAADKAQDDVNALAIRVSTAETNITQNSEAIALTATKTEVAETLGGYYTKEQADAAIEVKANSIMQTVGSTYITREDADTAIDAVAVRVTATETAIEQQNDQILLRATKTEVSEMVDSIEVGGRNLAIGSSDGLLWVYDAFDTQTREFTQFAPAGETATLSSCNSAAIEAGEVYTLSLKLKSIAEADRLLPGTGTTISLKHTTETSEISESYSSIKTSYQEYVKTFTAIESGVVTLSIDFLGTLNGVTLYVKDVKLEKGNKVTDWTPPVEDIDGQIGVASGTAKDAQNKAYETADRVDVAESLIQQLSDSIRMLVTDGNGASLMTQTSTGWTFSTKEIQEQADNASEGLDELQKEMGDTKSAVEVLESAVEDLGVLAEYIKIGTYTYTDDEGNEQTEPSIDLGESDTGFRLKITNTRILFTDGSSELVEINSKTKTLNIEKAEILNEMVLGGFVWKIRSNGNLGLIWKGAND